MWMRYWLAVLACGGLLMLPLRAYAGWDTFTVTRLASGATQVQPSVRTMLRDAMGAGWLETPVTGRTVLAGATAAVPVGAKSAGMRLGWTLSENAAGKLLARAIPVLGTAALAYEVAKSIRCYAAPGASSFGGLLECDAGVSQETVTQTTYRLNDIGTVWRSTPAEVWAEYKAYLDANHGACSPGYSWSSYIGGESTSWTAVVYGGCSTPKTKYQKGISSQTGNVTRCPASVDPTDGSKSVPAGSPVGPDGKCPTARYNGQWAAATEDTVAGKLAPVATGSLRLSDVVRDALSSGGQAAEDAIRSLGTPGVTGPASVAGPTRTETPPGGGSPVTYSTTYNITYAGDTFNYDETVSGSDGSSSWGAPPVTKVDVETCGLPGKPACKIDETGTATAADLSAAEAALEAAKSAQVAAVGEAAHARGSLGWNFTLSLPVGSCTPFEYVSRIGTMTVNPCTSSGVALWRQVLAWLVASMAALYCWRSVTSLGA